MQADDKKFVHNCEHYYKQQRELDRIVRPMAHFSQFKVNKEEKVVGVFYSSELGVLSTFEKVRICESLSLRFKYELSFRPTGELIDSSKLSAPATFRTFKDDTERIFWVYPPNQSLPRFSDVLNPIRRWFKFSGTCCSKRVPGTAFGLLLKFWSEKFRELFSMPSFFGNLPRLARFLRQNRQLSNDFYTELIRQCQPTQNH
jgi:hypothetical protein